MTPLKIIKGRGEGVHALRSHLRHRDALCNFSLGRLTTDAWLRPLPDFPA